MKALVIVCHPAPDSFNHALAAVVRTAWLDAGYDVTFHDLHAEAFDPVLTAAEMRGAASPDPVVQAHIAALRDSTLLAVVHPNCWGAPPAMMKGWIDRIFAPDAAYTFAKGSDEGDTPIGLLKLRAALILNTGNTAPDRERDHFGDPLDRIWRRCILEYCGVSRIERRLFGVVATSGADERQSWLGEARSLARKLAKPTLANASD